MRIKKYQSPDGPLPKRWKFTGYYSDASNTSPILPEFQATWSDLGPEMQEMIVSIRRKEEQERHQKAQEEYQKAVEAGKNSISRIAASIGDDYGLGDYSVPEEEKKYRGTKGYNQGVKQGFKDIGGAYLGLATMPLMAGEVGTYGLGAGLARLAAGSAASTVGATTLGIAGDYADNRLGTNFLGDAGRLIGGFVAFPYGMKAVNRFALRPLAVKGYTLGLPQETFMELRNEGFHKNMNRAEKSLFKTKHIVNPEERLMNEITDVPKAKGWQFHIDDFYKRPNIDLETGRSISTSSNKQYYENGLIKPGKSYIDPSGESDYIWFKEDAPYIKPKHSNIIKGLSGDLNTKTNQLVSGKPNLFPLSRGFDPNKSSIEIYEYYPLGNIKMAPKLHLKDQSVGTWGKVKFHTPNQLQPSATTYEVRSLRVPKYRPITVAEAQGRPKDIRFNYHLSEADYKKVLADANDFALKYGYPEIEDTPDALKQIQDMYRRHNTFGRTIADPDEFNPIWYHFGQEHRGLTTEQRAKIAATEGYPYAFGEKNPTDRVFVTGSPEVLEGYSAAEQPTFAVRRSVSLGHNPLKWRQNAEFTLGDWSKEMKPNEVRATSTNQGGSSELFLGTGNLSAKPLTSPTQLSGAFNEPVNGPQIGWLQQQGFKFPRTRLQAEDVAQTFKEYIQKQLRGVN